MRYLTNQEIFTKVKTHLLRQKRKSNSWMSGVCAYRGVNRTKCAVGCLIPDEQYRPDIEGLGITDARFTPGLLQKVLNASGIASEDFPLLRELQILHDSKDPNDWPEALKVIAATYDLEY